MDIYTTNRQRWIRRQNRITRAYDLFRVGLVVAAGIWLLSCNFAEVIK